MRRLVYFSILCCASILFAPGNAETLAQAKPAVNPSGQPTGSPAAPAKNECQKAIDFLFRMGKLKYYEKPDAPKLSLNVWWPKVDPEGRVVPRSILRGPRACERIHGINLDMERNDPDGRPPIRRANLTPLTQFPNIKHLTVRGRGFTNADLAPIARLRKLETLYVHDTSIDDKGLRIVRGLTALRMFGVTDSRVRGPGLVHLTRLPKLESLSVPRNRIGDSAMIHIGKMRGLNYLSISHTAITNKSARRFAGLKKLRTLDMRHTRLKGKGLRYIGRLPKLVSLNIFGTYIGAAGFAYLGRMPELDRVSLNGDQITDAVIKTLSRTPNWKYMNLWHTSWYKYGRRAGIISYSLKGYSHKDGTNHLNLRPTRTTRKSLRYLRRINLTSFEPSQFMTDKDVRLIARYLKKLEKLVLSKKNTRNALWHVPYMPKLKRLEVSCSKKIKREDLMIVYRKRPEIKYSRIWCMSERFAWEPVQKFPRR